ncbi:hypothetical protein V6N13_017332 [Hibiscus sabdariffa]|uniref:Uncharacterized protein n=1 Tax=Hibiscus sabdariffa TaxID=183260 RepID=A0ABR2CZ15_9ROSI
MSLVYLFLILNLWILKASSLQPGSRALLRALADNNGGGTDLKDFAVELNATDFDVVLKDTPATYAVVEFFAHCWDSKILDIVFQVEDTKMSSFGWLTTIAMAN